MSNLENYMKQQAIFWGWIAGRIPAKILQEDSHV